MKTDTRPRSFDGTAVQGYASLWGVADGGGDVVERGAFAASLRRTAQAGGRVRMLWQHDPREPIGVWDELREDARGLWVRGRLVTDAGKGREAAALLCAGAVDGLSIGFKALRATRDAKGRRRLAEIELWEVSLVTFPMLAAARASAAPPAHAPNDPVRAALADARARLNPPRNASQGA